MPIDYENETPAEYWKRMRAFEATAERYADAFHTAPTMREVAKKWKKIAEDEEKKSAN